MRRRIFWGTVAVAVTTLAIGGVAAAILIRRSVEDSIRTEFARQAAATARIIETQVIRDTTRSGAMGPVRDNPLPVRLKGSRASLPSSKRSGATTTSRLPSSIAPVN